jgi:manganese/zinc/iron transport system permease protein
MHHVAAVAVLIAVVSACVGWLAAWTLDTSAAGMIAVVLGGWYAVAVCCAPEDGLVARASAGVAFAWRVACEDSLARIWRAQEATGAGAVALPVPRSILERAASVWLQATGLVEVTPSGVRLSPAAAREAEIVVRSHRLWEAWLGRHADLPLDHLHPPAEWIEHHLGFAMRQQIADEMARDAADPHGREIPPEIG